MPSRRLQVTRSEEILKELVYANVTNSAAHWELYFSRKWKSLSLELSAWIESKYVNSCKKVQLDNLIEVRLMNLNSTTRQIYGGTVTFRSTLRRCI